MKKQLSKEQWLDKTLRLINLEGFGALKIDRLARIMGVTKGSFYWHFENKKDFIVKLIEHWDKKFTDNVIEHINKLEGNPSECLLELMLFITNNQLAQYDFAMHAMAQNESYAFPLIKKVLEKRIEFVATLFSAMGFNRDEVNLRSRATVMFMAQEQNSLLKDPVAKQRKRIKLAHALFTKP